ncbi:hypothetical protein [Streptomyces sp. H34-S4]|uniref:hypothetical protein n=1 Tax=Streptomyces sp. H34-S4 TaxID=2996463 RepID=UPI00226F2049|nr:hypothetical protein [Streptomyces sp. H34-S4]MCY0933614.1 hypothetical protein [Streptomyces sp. H34-S4]
MKVTIKYGKGHDDSWVIFEGTTQEIRTDVLSYFGMDPESQRGLSLSSIVVNATNLAHGKGLIATQLGATVVEETTTEPAVPTNDPWAAAAASSPQTSQPSSASVAKPANEGAHAWILGEIAGKTTILELKKLWAENQSFFAEPAVMDAWKAKGKVLKALEAA